MNEAQDRVDMKVVSIETRELKSGANLYFPRELKRDEFNGLIGTT